MTQTAAAAGEQDTSTKDETEPQDVEDAAAADQGDDTSADDSDKSDEEDWKAKFEAQQRIARKLERRNKADARRIAELEGATAASTKDSNSGDKADAEKVDVEKIRAEARAEAEKDALQERILDKIETKAAKAFADPADAVAMLMRDHKVDDFLDDGKPDVEAIQDALKELLEKKPYLGAAAQGGKNRFQGSAEGGAKTPKPARPQSLDEAVRRSFAPQ